MQLCKKCGEEVPMGNDAFILLGIARKQGTLLSLGEHYHLLPDGECKGSPDLCQYLGEQIDSPQHPHQKDKRVVREAYHTLQQAVQAVHGDGRSEDYYLSVTHQIALLEARR